MWRGGAHKHKMLNANLRKNLNIFISFKYKHHFALAIMNIGVLMTWQLSQSSLSVSLSVCQSVRPDISYV
jgi:hypothetical protein